VLFPDLEGFRPPDRLMSGTDARVGRRITEGMGITEATLEDAPGAILAESNMMVDRDEDYNTRYAGFKGALMAFERTKLIPRRPAALDLTTMIRAAGAGTAEAVVDHFIERFLSVPLAPQDRAVLVDFGRARLGAAGIQPSPDLEAALREVLYLVLSTPEYQLG
jgi:hypothetical protein